MIENEYFNVYLTSFLDLVAQLVEHLPFKERVLGSSPSQVTTLFLAYVVKLVYTLP